MAPQTTVICAVWHGDAKRHERLAEHIENLSRQSVKVESIYVFDGGDQPPKGFSGRSVSVAEKLTIYQAWNVALSLVTTPFVMNLNLDDRLASDAVELLQNALNRTGAACAGGDWKICYSEEETALVGRSTPVGGLPVFQEWPPKKGAQVRLGSGTVEGGTYGPATLWRMAAHIEWPRYPWRLADGTPLKVAGDSAWWAVLASNPRLKLTRVPMIIGHYFSHPEEQAEFREPVDEVALIRQRGLSRL